jgi:hypothetical protein
VNKTILRCVAMALLVAPLLAPLACAKSTLSIAEGKYAFTSLDYPGAALTQAYGNNPRGDIVGTYQLPTGRDATVLPKGVQNATGKEYHGFIFKDGKFTTVDYPNIPGKKTDYTMATAIDTAGNVVGYYAWEGEPLTSAYGFTMTKDGKWSTVPNKVDPAMGEPTMKPSPFRILPDGTQYG